MVSPPPGLSALISRVIVALACLAAIAILVIFARRTNHDAIAPGLETRTSLKSANLRSNRR